MLANFVIIDFPMHSAFGNLWMLLFTQTYYFTIQPNLNRLILQPLLDYVIVTEVYVTCFQLFIITHLPQNQCQHSF